MENNTLSLREVIIKNINCVVEGVTTKKEAVEEIIDACFKEKISLNNLTLEEANIMYELQRRFLFCGDGQVMYTAEELN